MKNILFLLTILIFSCSDSPKKEEPKKEKPQKEVEEVSQDDYQSPEINYGNSSYWYVSYSCRRKSDDAEWRGYEVIKLDETYFDVYEAIKIIYPTYIMHEDYCGIDFFKEVTEQTYTEFIKVEPESN